METIQIINGYNEATKVIESAKTAACSDAMAIFSKISRINRYINEQISLLLDSYAN